MAPAVRLRDRGVETQPVWELRRALERIMATAEEAEPGSITLLITEAMGAHFRLPASPTDTVGHVEAALGVASGGRPANSVRLVFENTKLHDDGITLAKLKIEASEVALGLAPQDPAEGARLRSDA